MEAKKKPFDLESVSFTGENFVLNSKCHVGSFCGDVVVETDMIF